MQHLETLRKLFSAAAAVRDITYETKVYDFPITLPVTFYLDVQDASITITPWSQPRIAVTARLQVGFGWRVQGEQDEVGVYVVAKRKAVVGMLARAEFTVRLPPETHLALKLAQSQLTLNDLTTTLHIPPRIHAEIDVNLP
jgi:hypothetical protein